MASHAVKCQDDIDHAFEEMFSVLQERKQAMKVEAVEHYSSIIGIFENQREHLKEVQSEMEEVAISVSTSVEDDDQNFLGKFESTMMRIKNLKESLQAVPLSVTKPQLLATQVVTMEMLQCYMKTKCYLYNLADPKMCVVEGTLLTKTELQVDHQETFFIALNDSKGKSCPGDNRVEVQLDLLCLQGKFLGNSTKGKVEAVSPGHVKVILTPQRRGQHKLSVKVNGAHIMNSPFTVTINMPPKLLSQPVATISGLEDPTGLIYSRGKVIATEMEQNRIIEILGLPASYASAKTTHWCNRINTRFGS